MAEMPDAVSKRLPTGVMLGVAVLLAIPVLALLLVPIYAKDGPHLWGFPFFYWYQFAWVFLASAFTYGAYALIRRTRGEEDDA
jgi:Protein of unknown function (DUF3311)